MALCTKAYAKWVGKRLPTAEEWEVAIRHPQEKVFPWGDDWRNNLILSKNIQTSWTFPETKPIGTGKNGRSVSGIEDFAGQVSEWTSNVMPHHGVQFRMLQGASWFHRDPISYRSAFGYYSYEGWSSAFTGFRCASDTHLPHPKVSKIIKNIHEKENIRQIDTDGVIKIQSASGNSSYISILVPFFGSEWIGLSAPEGVTWEGKSLLNWYDKRDLKWNISTDNYASYVMQFPDIELHAEFKTGKDFVDQVFTVINHTGRPGWFRSSSCFNLQSHPLFYDCEALRTYTLTKNDKFELIRNFERPGECIHWIIGSVGTELEGLKRAMLAVFSQDDKWVIGCARADNDGRFTVACNMCFTCLHPDSSYYVDQKRSSKLRMYFIKGGLDDLLSRFDDDISQGGLA
jgi:hypothetical protein